MANPILRVASYNIHKGVGIDRRRSPERILAVLNQIDADIIALQEADRRFGPREAVLPPLLIDRRTDYQVAPLDVQADSIGWHGNTILTRKSANIRFTDIIRLPHLEPRGAVVAEVEFANGCELRLYGMHLDLSGLWRRRQATSLLARYNNKPHMPTLMAGDMNEWRPSGGCLEDYARHFDFAPCGQSFPARAPIGQLDRIMMNSAVELVDCGVHNSLLARRASDHLPIWADIRIR